MKAQYDYDATAQGELSLKEEQTLLVFGEEEDGWLLVQEKDSGKVGYVPGNYVEVVPHPYLHAQLCADRGYSLVRLSMMPVPPLLLLPWPPKSSFRIPHPVPPHLPPRTSIPQSSSAPLPPRSRQMPSRLGRSQRSTRRGRRRRVLSALVMAPYSSLARLTRYAPEWALFTYCPALMLTWSFMIDARAKVAD